MESINTKEYTEGKKTPENKGVYKNLRWAYRNSLRFNRKNYVNRMIEERGCDAKKLYSAVILLTNKDREVILPKEEEDKVIANKFMAFFKTKNFDNQGSSQELP